MFAKEGGQQRAAFMAHAGGKQTVPRQFGGRLHGSHATHNSRGCRTVSCLREEIFVEADGEHGPHAEPDEAVALFSRSEFPGGEIEGDRDHQVALAGSKEPHGAEEDRIGDIGRRG